MSSAPGATVPLPSEMGGPLESSFTHLVDKSSAQQGGEADQLARTFVSAFVFRCLPGQFI